MAVVCVVFAGVQGARLLEEYATFAEVMLRLD